MKQFMLLLFALAISSLSFCQERPCINIVKQAYKISMGVDYVDNGQITSMCNSQEFNPNSLTEVVEYLDNFLKSHVETHLGEVVQRAYQTVFGHGASPQEQRGFYPSATNPFRNYTSIVKYLKGYVEERKDKKINLRITDIFCSKTTEEGEDEIYFIIVGTSSKGKVIKTTFPVSDLNSFSTNDNGPKRHNKDILLYNGPIENGETFNFTISVMEHDGGNSEQVRKIADQIAILTADIPEYGQIIAVAAEVLNVILKIFPFEDTDDYIGTFFCQPSLIDNSYSVKWHRGERCHEDGNAEGHKEFKMNGDGSNYKIWVDATMSYITD